MRAFPIRSLQVALAKEVAKHTESCLNSTNEELRADLLLVLLGCVLQVQEAETTNNTVVDEQEVQHIAGIAIQCFLSATVQDVQDAALDILRYLPARTINEIHFVVTQAEQAQDLQVRGAYCEALRYAQPEDDIAKKVLEKVGKDAQVAQVREAARRALR